MALGGTKDKMIKYKTMTHQEKGIYKDILKRINPKALDLLNSPMFQQSQKYISDFLKTSPEQQFAAYEKPIMSQFQQEIVPGLAEQFAGMGAENSSGFQQALGGAGANLAERLGMLKQDLMSNYRQQQMSAAGMGAQMAQMPVSNMFQQIQQAFSTPSFGYQFSQGRPGAAAGILPGIGQGLGTAAGMWGLNAFMPGAGTAVGAASRAFSPASNNLGGYG